MIDSKSDAVEVLALPHKQDRLAREQLLQSGYNTYDADTDTSRFDQLVADVETFGLNALQFTHPDAADPDLFTTHPGKLTTVATLASVAVKQHPELKDTVEATNGSNIQVLYDIRKYFGHHTTEILEGDLLQDIAEAVYEKDTVHAGRTCTGIEYHDPLDSYCFKIPVLAAEPEILRRDDDRTPPYGFEDETIYIPIEDIDDKYEDELGAGFRSLTHTHEDWLEPAQLEEFLRREQRLSSKITRMLDGGQRSRIWRNWREGERVVDTLQAALEADDDVDLGTTLEASTLFEVLDRYDPEYRAHRQVVAQFPSVKSLTGTLDSIDDHPSIDINRRRGKPNLYTIEQTSLGADPLDASHPEDLFEFPCFEAMSDRLEREGPTRNDLFNFVRVAWWLREYYENRPGDRVVGEKFLDDMKETFKRWPWYDPAETEYQVTYEIEHGDIDGNLPRPRACGNEKMQQYCVGREECPYSLWQSPDYPDEMYDIVDDNDDSF